MSPPAILAVVSQDAVPGDSTYPIKRKMEDAILWVASFNSTTKAAFAASRSNSRYQEVTTLIGRGQVSQQALTDLVDQSNQAALDASNIKDPNSRKEAIDKLSNSLDQFDTGLSSAQQRIAARYAASRNSSNIQNSNPNSSQQNNNNNPNNNQQSDQNTNNNNQIDDTRAQLEEIRRRIKEEQDKLAAQAAARQRMEQNQNRQAPAPTRPVNTAQPTPEVTKKPKDEQKTQPSKEPKAEKLHTPEPDKLAKTGDYCRDNPVSPPGDLKWNTVSCNSSRCNTDADCPTQDWDPDLDHIAQNFPNENRDQLKQRSRKCYQFSDVGGSCLILK